MPRTARKRIALLAAIIIGTLILVPSSLGLALYQGAFTTRTSAAELSALLAHHYRIHRPEGPGPFPTALLVTGCVGVREHAELWAGRIVEAGWAAVIVDSHGPRGWERPEYLQRICTGRMFWGTSRAGDVLVALDDVRRMPFVDPGRLAIVAWSHGAWAVMDLLALNPPDRLPFNLTDLPRGFAERRFEGVVGTVLFYPYSAIGNRARGRGWPHRARTLMLLAGADTIVPNKASLGVVEALRRQGEDVEVHVYDGINHGFDDTFHWPGSPLRFEPETTADAMARVAKFLKDLAESSS